MKSRLATTLHVALVLCCAAETADAQSGALAVESLECRGNTVTRCSYVLEHVDLVVGGEVNETAVEDARYRLAALPNFSAVDIYLQRGSTPGRARVIVEVREQDPLTTHYVAGTSYYLSSISQRLAARITHQNLFGTGRLIEGLVDARVPLRDPSRRELHARVQYVDPRAFGSPRYYIIAGISHEEGRIEERNGSQFINDDTGIDVAVGRRIWDFSYVAIGYRYNWRSAANQYVCQRRDPCEFDDLAHEHILSFIYGWNSEDDPYFPTQGSRFVAGIQFNSPNELTTGSLGFRKTWRIRDDALVSFNAGASPGTEYQSSFEETFAFGVSYAQPLAPNERFGILRGRWYVSTGWNQIESHGNPTEISSRIGIKAGVRFDTKAFGIVDLYVFALGEATLWGG